MPHGRLWGCFIGGERLTELVPGPAEGLPLLDGISGVLLGLFICSRPAANMLDLLFTRRGQAASSEWSAIGWLVLNGLVMFVGWIVITIGATRLIE